MMTEKDFAEICEQYRLEFSKWKFTDPRKKKALRCKRKLFKKPKFNVFTKKQTK